MPPFSIRGSDAANAGVSKEHGHGIGGEGDGNEQREGRDGQQSDINEENSDEGGNNDEGECDGNVAGIEGSMEPSSMRGDDVQEGHHCAGLYTSSPPPVGPTSTFNLATPTTTHLATPVTATHLATPLTAHAACASVHLASEAVMHPALSPETHVASATTTNLATSATVVRTGPPHLAMSSNYEDFAMLGAMISPDPTYLSQSDPFDGFPPDFFTTLLHETSLSTVDGHWGNSFLMSAPPGDSSSPFSWSVRDEHTRPMGYIGMDFDGSQLGAFNDINQDHNLGGTPDGQASLDLLAPTSAPATSTETLLPPVPPPNPQLSASPSHQPPVQNTGMQKSIDVATTLPGSKRKPVPSQHAQRDNAIGSSLGKENHVSLQGTEGIKNMKGRQTKKNERSLPDGGSPTKRTVKNGKRSANADAKDGDNTHKNK